MKQRILSLFLSLCMLSTLSLGLAIPAGAAYDGGSGTRSDPYLISTAAQLIQFRDQVNSGSNTLCASLTGNIDLKYQDWDPIGISSSGYRGVFDGNGYAIQNLTISRVSSGTSSGGKTLHGGGLFGIIGKGGTVKRVNVDGTFSIQETMSNNPDIGTLCGANLGTIEECFATVTVENFDLTISNSSSGNTNLGGLAGVNAGTIRNCYVVGSMDASTYYTSSTRPFQVGGLVGYTYVGGSTLENCYAAVTIRANSNGTLNTGGLMGNLAASGTFQNLHCNGDLFSGLLGTGSTSRLKGCSQMTSAQMRTAAFAAQLGNAFRQDTAWVNQGYPTLAVMAYEEESDSSDWFQDETLDGNNQAIFNALIPPELQNRDLKRDITRSEFCAVAVQLYEQMGGRKLDPSQLTTPFTDISSDAIKKAYALGITNGVSATRFDPYTNISREQLATMLTRVHKALSLPGWTLATDGFYRLDYTGIKAFADDRDISPYAKPSVYFMAKNGIINGINAERTIFAPRNVTTSQEAIGYANASREQALIMAVRMFQKL